MSSSSEEKGDSILHDTNDSTFRRQGSMSSAAISEINNRQKYTLQGALHPEREGRLFEHFVVTGLPSNFPSSSLASLPSSTSSGRTFFPKTPSKPYPDTLLHFEPQVLYCYPPNEQVNKLMVTQFSFPTGLSSLQVRRLSSEIEKNQLVFAPLSKLEESNSSFVFLLTAQQGLLYGICVVQDELLREDLSFGAGSCNEKIDETSGYVVAPRCYMFLTKFPFFTTHFQVLYSLLAVERTSRMFKRLAPEEHKDSDVLALLYQYYSFEVPKDEEKLQIKLPEEELAFHCPAGDENEQLTDFCLGCLLKLVPLDSILLILSAILQEYPVLIISEQASVISAVVMGLIPLMRPYIWQGTFIPILPVRLEECVHSPMPYIIGLQSVPAESLELLDEVLVLDVDQNRIIKGPNDLSALPYHLNLKSKLETLHNALYKSTPASRMECYLQPYLNQPTEIDIGNAILNLLRQYQRDVWNVLERGISSISNFNLTKPRHLFKLVCAVADDNYNGFLKRFLNTQHWHFYYEKVHPQEVQFSSIFLNSPHSAKPRNSLSIIFDELSIDSPLTRSVGDHLLLEFENASSLSDETNETSDNNNNNNNTDGVVNNNSNNNSNDNDLTSSVNPFLEERAQIVALLTSDLDLDDDDI